MDLSRLTRPAILCQCSRCSSSLAALENEWSRLSNSYALAAGWLSIELHRISIAAEKRIIPQTSDLVVLRGRILQEVSCKLCQQKLGVLSALDNGPHVFWKLSKVSFREIVTMRTVEPTFVDVPVERLVAAPSKEPTPTPRRDRNSMQAGALVPTGPTDVDNYNMSVEQQIQHQGLNIDYISNSVNSLHDTMSELKSAFTAMRIELNSPGRSPEMGRNLGSDFNMVTTVLKELKAKSEEIEYLKLENEALKLKNRYADEQNLRQQSSYLMPMNEPLPEVRSPGLLQAGRKRPWPDSWPSGRSEAIADTFDDDDNDNDSIGDFSLAESATTIPSMKIPLRESEPSTTNNPLPEPSRQSSPNLRIEVQQPPHNNAQQQPLYKRPRLSQSTNEKPQSNGNPEKKPGRGRPRKSLPQPTPPDTARNTKPSPLNDKIGNAGSNGQNDTDSAIGTPSDRDSTKENRSTRGRSVRARSRAPSRAGRRSLGGADQPQTAQEEPSDGVGENPGSSGRKDQPKENGRGGNETNGDQANRKARVAERDARVRQAMQREEAMDTESR